MHALRLYLRKLWRHGIGRNEISILNDYARVLSRQSEQVFAVQTCRGEILLVRGC